MGVSKGGKGKAKGVIHSKVKTSKGKGKGGKAPQEKRVDPSDGNGPFSFASFVRYHGEQKGKALWEKAGRQAQPTKAVVLTKNGKGAKGKGKGKDPPAKAAAATKKVETKAKTKEEEPAATKPKGKGKGAKGKGKGKDKAGKSSVVKRIDPSDGNGPFAYESFIKFHGEELGSALWEQAGLIEEAETEMEE